jgi:hypothetical protein
MDGPSNKLFVHDATVNRQRRDIISGIFEKYPRSFEPPRSAAFTRQSNRCFDAEPSSQGKRIHTSPDEPIAVSKSSSFFYLCFTIVAVLLQLFIISQLDFPGKHLSEYPIGPAVRSREERLRMDSTRKIESYSTVISLNLCRPRVGWRIPQ